MKILRIAIANFGCLSNFAKEFGDGLNVIQADNGFGKTTMAEFIKAMFYGLKTTSKQRLEENERKKYCPWNGGRFGGSIEFVVNERAFRIERFFSLKSRDDTFALYDLATGREVNDYSENIGNELFNLDVEAYERSTYFSQQKYAYGVNDCLTERLANLVETDKDSVGYERAMTKLNDARKEYQKTGNRGMIADLQNHASDVMREIQKCQKSASDLQELREEFSVIQNKIGESNEQLALLNEQFKMATNEAIAKAKQEAVVQRQIDVDTLQEKLNNINKWFLKDFSPEEIDYYLKEYSNVYADNNALEKMLLEIQNKEEKCNKPVTSLPIKTKGLVVGMIISLLVSFCGWVLVIASGFFAIMGGIGLLCFVCVLCLYLFKKRNKLEEGNWSQWQILQEEKAEYNYKLRSVRLIREELEKKIDAFIPIQDDYQEALLMAKNKSVEKDFLVRELISKINDLPKDREIIESKYDLVETERQIKMLQERGEVLSEAKYQLCSKINKEKDLVEKLPLLENEYANLQEKLAKANERLHVITETITRLNAAKHNLSLQYLLPMKNNFQKYGEMILSSLGEFSLDVDLHLRFIRNSASWDQEYFSAGLQDVFTFCMRLALNDVLFSKENYPFMVLDDPFVNLDDERQSVVNSLLQKLSLKQQIIYFVCHSSRSISTN